MTVTVYSKPSCPQCTYTIKALEKSGIEYRKVDVTLDADAAARLKALGYTQAPVVEVGDEHWAGFRPDRIKALVG